LDSIASEVVGKHVPGWPSGALSKGLSPDRSTDGEATILRDLVRRGVLICGKRGGKDATPITVSSASSALLGEYETVSTTASFEQFLCFVFAALKGEAISLLGGKNAVMKYLCYRATKAAKDTRLRKSSENDRWQDETRGSLCIFRRLRPILWPIRDPWLETLLLYLFLTARKVPVILVLGVSKTSQKLHCWLQVEDALIDDSPTVTSSFVPLVAF